MRHEIKRILIIISLILLGYLALSSSAVAQNEEEFLGSDSFLFCAIFVIIIALIIAILVAIWVYRDANSRGMNGTLWVILVIVVSFFGNIFGFVIIIIVYLVVRSGHPRYPPGYYPPPGYGYPPPGYYPLPPGFHPPPPPRY